MIAPHLKWGCYLWYVKLTDGYMGFIQLFILIFMPEIKK